MSLIENNPAQGNNQTDEIGNESLETCVRKISSFGGLPAISHQIQEVMTIATNERTSASQFANVILKNVSLTTKLLRLVNSVYFFQRTPVYTVTHAIKLLGWDIIRDTAASIIFLTDFGKKSDSVRELLQLSVLTANNAMGIAARCNYPRPEEAYLCGMFSVFGELLVATYMPEEFAKIVESVKTSGEEQTAVALKVIGFTFTRLGKAMMNHWGMPEKLAAGTHRLESVSLKPQTEWQKLSLIASFSHELTDRVYRSGSEKENTTWLKSFLSTYGDFLQISEKNVEEILSSSFAKTEKAFSSVHISLDKIRFVQSIKPAPAEIATAAEKIEEDAAEESVEIDKDSLRRFSMEVKSVLQSDERLEVNDIVVMIMEAIYRGAAFDRVLFCLSDKNRTHIHARLAVGQGAEELKEKFLFPISFLEGPVGPTMLRQIDIFVEDIKKSRYSQSNFAGIVGARSFMMVPVKVHQQVIGCLYADRITEPLVLDDEDKKLLLMMREDLCAEMASRKQQDHPR